MRWTLAFSHVTKSVLEPPLGAATVSWTSLLICHKQDRAGHKAPKRSSMASLIFVSTVTLVRDAKTTPSVLLKTKRQHLMSWDENILAYFQA